MALSRQRARARHAPAEAGNCCPPDRRQRYQRMEGGSRRTRSGRRDAPAGVRRGMMVAKRDDGGNGSTWPEQPHVSSECAPSAADRVRFRAAPRALSTRPIQQGAHGGVTSLGNVLVCHAHNVAMPRRLSSHALQRSDLFLRPDGRGIEPPPCTDHRGGRRALRRGGGGGIPSQGTSMVRLRALGRPDSRRMTARRATHATRFDAPAGSPAPYATLSGPGARRNAATDASVRCERPGPPGTACPEYDRPGGRARHAPRRTKLLAGAAASPSPRRSHTQRWRRRVRLQAAPRDRSAARAAMRQSLREKHASRSGPSCQRQFPHDTDALLRRYERVAAIVASRTAVA